MFIFYFFLDDAGFVLKILIDGDIAFVIIRPFLLLFRAFEETF